MLSSQQHQEKSINMMRVKDGERNRGEWRRVEEKVCHDRERGFKGLALDETAVEVHSHLYALLSLEQYANH